jgi:DNA-binding NarL/FixJ family response regulator
VLRQAVLYGLALGALVLLLDWLDYSHALRLYSISYYIVAIGVLFAAVGLWVGYRLTWAPRSATSVPNDVAVASLGISAREIEVLRLVAAGQSNKVIARTLSNSPNAVKTRGSRVFEKLDVNSRTEAVERARGLDILP